jgi:hypothetical protein
MLNEGQRTIKPENIRNQVQWDKAEAVVVLCLGRTGEENKLHMSTLTVAELAFLSMQLQAHITCLMGHMKES